MSEKRLCPCSTECALQRALESLGGKWKLPILCSLAANGSSRFNDLMRNVQGISNTMLTKSLRELLDTGLVKRSEFLEVPVRVEYDLTEKAKRLQPILLQLVQWETETNQQEADG